MRQRYLRQHHAASFYLPRVKCPLLWHPLLQPNILPGRGEEEEWGMGRKFFNLANILTTQAMVQNRQCCHERHQTHKFTNDTRYYLSSWDGGTVSTHLRG